MLSNMRAYNTFIDSIQHGCFCSEVEQSAQRRIQNFSSLWSKNWNPNIIYLQACIQSGPFDQRESEYSFELTI